MVGYARRFPHGHDSFLGLGSEKKWYGSNTYKPNGEWDDVAERMLLNFSEEQVLWNEEPYEAKEVENCLFIFVVTQTL